MTIVTLDVGQKRENEKSCSMTAHFQPLAFMTLSVDSLNGHSKRAAGEGLSE